MYEIYFEPKGGIWRIRIITYYFLFFPVSSVVCEARKEEGKAAGFVQKNFSTHEEALQYAANVGLPQAYKLLRKESYSTWVNEAAHATGPSR